jgi:hypothetical protein
MVESYVNIEDIAIFEYSVIGNTVTDNLVDTCAD